MAKRILVLMLAIPIPDPQDISPRRCQILENGEWKDIPCK